MSEHSEHIERLRATIRELESELAQLSEIDEQTREVLEQAALEIRGALDPEDLEHQSLASRLKHAAERFETSHPNLFGIVSRTIDALGQIGI